MAARDHESTPAKRQRAHMHAPTPAVAHGPAPALAVAIVIATATATATPAAITTHTQGPGPNTVATTALHEPKPVADVATAAASTADSTAAANAGGALSEALAGAQRLTHQLDAKSVRQAEDRERLIDLGAELDENTEMLSEAAAANQRGEAAPRRKWTELFQRFKLVAYDSEHKTPAAEAEVESGGLYRAAGGWLAAGWGVVVAARFMATDRVNAQRAAPATMVMLLCRYFTTTPPTQTIYTALCQAEGKASP